ncbi:MULTISPECIES: hypothetical protein [unclassified Sphingobacterium]|uniref:hypothetical protein n=1 Tax=unclassified Sphingobacterium TaxID=2609468 RepID=UPI0025F3C561|nr:MULTISPECIES: hypothetical protein [unclassified Sphingobacterium]
MENTSKSKVEIFHQALTDPGQLPAEDLQRLVEEYPYAQPIRFVYERQQFLSTGMLSQNSLALLYAPNAAWLSEYVSRQPLVVPELEAEPDGYIAFEDVDQLSAEVEEETISTEDESYMETEEETVQSEYTEEEVIEEEQVKVVDDIEEAQLEKEYFPEFQLSGEEIVPDPQEETVELEKEYFPEFQLSGDEIVQVSSEEEERVSLYHDDLMPYSFLWWLHKTRLEHAGTYRPFAEVKLPKPQKGQFDPSKLDEHILDQQIREHVFRSQSPEAKLSEEVKHKPVQPLPKKLDDVIEKFIREEPQIKPPQADQLNMENKARKSAEDQFTLVTETLAIIYADQGLFPKAIEVYKKLILKFPEKNAYFAGRIKELEQKLN